MLKRLRIQFIAIIMALLTLLLGSVIGLIYHFTRQSLVKESHDMMDSLAASPFQLARLDEASNRDRGRRRGIGAVDENGAKTGAEFGGFCG